MSQTPTPFTAPTHTRAEVTAFHNAHLYNYGVPAHPRGLRPLAVVKTDNPRSQVSHLFSPGAHRYQEVVPATLPELLAKIDREHAHGERFVVVSRQTKSKAGTYQTTVMHENTRIFYRAFHETGISTALKGVVKRRSANVKVLRSGQSYYRTVGKRADAGEGTAAVVEVKGAVAE